MSTVNYEVGDIVKVTNMARAKPRSPWKAPVNKNNRILISRYPDKSVLNDRNFLVIAHDTASDTVHLRVCDEPEVVLWLGAWAVEPVKLSPKAEDKPKEKYLSPFTNTWV